MTRSNIRRLGIVFALTLVLTPVWFSRAAQENSSFRTQPFDGKVVSLRSDK